MKYSGYADMALNFQQMFKSLKIANLEIIANLKKIIYYNDCHFIFEELLGSFFSVLKRLKILVWSNHLFSCPSVCVVLWSLHRSGYEVYMDSYLPLSRHALVSERAWYFPACLEISFLPIFLLKYQIQVSTLKYTSKMITVVSLSKFFISLQNWISSFVL